MNDTHTLYTQIAIRRCTEAMMRPSVLMRPHVFKDGNQWCALHGPDIQTGVVGFGNTPAAAMLAFDKAWEQP